ncbi:MAG: hypothetical protein JNN27_02125 [Planctomycetes bacterium]|nr:hypothetical protein [Planctomycetota bacterium]
MRNVLILGSGRSGTSMLAGAFAHAGWHVGADPYPGRSSNPKGFFESKEINGVNEYLLALGAPELPLGAWQRWLAELPADWVCPTDSRAVERIAALTQRAPYCFKDPRFSYTLPAWAPFTQDALRLCVFRHPLAVARSMVVECEQESYLRGVNMTLERALALWLAQHRRILDVLRADGEWCFAHVAQVVDGTALDRLETLVGAPLAREFPEAGLQRQRSDGELSGALADTYAELCELAGLARASGSRAAPRWAAALAREVDALERAAGSVLEQELEHWLATGREGTSPGWRSVRGRGLAECERALLDALPNAALWRAQLSSNSRAAARSALEQLAQFETLARTYRRYASTSWAELQARAAWPLSTAAATRVVSWPQWRQPELEALLRAWRSGGSAAAGACLVLRHAPGHDGPQPAALAALEAAYSRVCPDGAAVEVLLLGDEFRTEHSGRLARSVQAALSVGSDAFRAQWLASLGVPCEQRPERLAALCAPGAAAAA